MVEVILSYFVSWYVLQDNRGRVECFHIPATAKTAEAWIGFPFNWQDQYHRAMRLHQPP